MNDVINEKSGLQPPEAVTNIQPQPFAKPIGAEQVKKFNEILEKYKSGKVKTEQRIISSEEWWKLRNTKEERKTTEKGEDGGFESESGWLHNVIVSKHADAMESFPEPNILPREPSDRPEATILSSILPCILEQNDFERTYSDVMWQKLRTGTGVYKVVWDKNKLNGLGDITIEKANLLNIYWEPGIADIQKSRYFFHTELADKDILEEMYPELKDKLKGNKLVSREFYYDDHRNNDNKTTVVEVYYHKYINGKNTLQYCKYVDENVIFATENEPQFALTGLYDHGKYPYVFDALYPIEGSPCGYGFVDVCRNPQTEIDLLKTSIVKNAMSGATPRVFASASSGINEEEFLDLNKAVVHVQGNVNDDYVKPIPHTPLDGSYVNVLDRTIQELRETSGNTETSTGNVSSGVTAASAIAALQEASGKGSRDSTQASYRAFSELVEICIELIRQEYDKPRQFRIIGQYGAERFISYSNAGLQPQYQGNDFGQDMGYRLPVFDIKVSAQKKNVYTKVTQNELAMQFFDKGFFNPQMTDQAVMCLELMDFDGKDEVLQEIIKNGTMFQKLIQYMQLAIALAAKAAPHMVQGLSQDIMQTMGANPNAMMSMGGGSSKMFQSDNIAGIGKNEPTNVKNARARSGEATQPDGGRVIGERK